MIIDLLKQRGVVKGDKVTATPLTGGVSCEIFLVEDGDYKCVAKRALAKLNVKQDWFADVSRNIYEQRYLKYVGEKFPQWVPDIIESLEDENLFVMEFFPARFQDWKKYLLKGELSNQVATNIGEALGSIHKISWSDEKAKSLFDSDTNFHELRISPYFEFMMEHQPDLHDQLEILNKKIQTNKRCLVHGDFSPKNILVSENEVKIVDCEVAWYGDPTFDIAFMLHHLLLKSCHFNDAQFCDLAEHFMTGYETALGKQYYQQIEQSHLIEVTLMLMLARIDGKSPVEYLSDQEKTAIRTHVRGLLNTDLSSLTNLIQGVRKYEN